MSALQFPCTLFKSQNRMDDNSASDMRCGDLTESQLKMQFHLVDVSSRVDPWTLTKITPFLQPHSMFHGSRGQGEKVTRQRCATILFDELRHLSRGFSFYGPYSHLIKEMIDHMQYGDGKPFSHASLNSALKRQIVDDKTENSTLLRIKESLHNNINWDKKICTVEGKNEIKKIYWVENYLNSSDLRIALMEWGSLFMIHGQIILL